ncbi:putative membrane protein [Rubrobacter radiotolerans]|uniref:Heparan-alpha-glucosaminide N-acetyltransferase n=1 Tax=Rubrobacter radiotolerans TaxID=42256 RepID=A0A023X175_RUBRA|nr:heparan-alpha-glucosaminide N-acetyltransferase [Rubrobacter radiotolerans]AHY45956.1 putative membrane protein [Rubrobacter radiotolerans]MDX5893369.1 heparan-alpha-glucosaminide N-acetyltransferase [Rubrobacter radiotolerans]SMC03587.1 Uncharacterized membrane protein [Rubrobacter radiotolerans DSM 5868]
MAAGARFWELDVARSGAILMMVVYHTVYDLYAFGGYDIEAVSGPWARFADLTAGSFLFIVGVSLAISSERDLSRGGMRFAPYGRRALKVFGAGMLLTAVFLALGMGYVVFGILHLIGASIVLAYPLLKARLSNLSLILLGAIVFGSGLYVLGAIGDGSLPQPDTAWLLPLGFVPQEGFPMPDYRPLLPWFGVVLFGIVFGRLVYGDAARGKLAPRRTAPAPLRPFVFLGRHSLLFYLVHQPVIIAALALLGVITL